MQLLTRRLLAGYLCLVGAYGRPRWRIFGLWVVAGLLSAVVLAWFVDAYAAGLALLGTSIVGLGHAFASPVWNVGRELLRNLRRAAPPTYAACGVAFYDITRAQQDRLVFRQRPVRRRLPVMVFGSTLQELIDGVQDELRSHDETRPLGRLEAEIHQRGLRPVRLELETLAADTEVPDDARRLMLWRAGGRIAATVLIVRLIPRGT